MPDIHSEFKLELQKAREAIDQHDSTILSAITKRAEIVTHVMKIKDKYYQSINKPNQTYIKPDREYKMIKKMVNSTPDFKYSKNLIFYIWRNIISASNFLEQDLIIGVSGSPANRNKYLLQVYQYYGFDAKISEFSHTQDMFSALQKNTIQLAISDTSSGNYYQQLGGDPSIKVAAQIPKIKTRDDSVALFMSTRTEYPQSLSGVNIIYFSQNAQKYKKSANLKTISTFPDNSCIFTSHDSEGDWGDSQKIGFFYPDI